MDTSLFLTFVLVSFGLIVIPGPNVLVIVSTSMLHGKTRGLQTVAGTSLAMLIQLALVGVGTSWFVSLFADGMSVLRWSGVACLFYLGLRHLTQIKSTHDRIPELSAPATFARGFLVSFSNPKTLLFFSAFLPQFVSSSSHYGFQIGMLSGTFWFLAIILDSSYALFADRLKSFLQVRFTSKVQHGAGGLLFLGAGTWLAVTRRL